MNNVLGHVTAVNFLKLVAAVLLSQSLSAMILGGDGKWELEPTSLFVKKQIDDAAGIYELIDANTKQLDGVCSFNSDGRMDLNRAAVWNKISIRYGTGNDGANAGSIDYTTALPSALKNAEIEILQDGEKVFRKPIHDLIPGTGVGTATQKTGDDYAELASIRLLRDDKDVKINLRFPSGVAMPAAGAGTTPFVYVSIDALVTRKK